MRSAIIAAGLLAMLIFAAGGPIFALRAHATKLAPCHTHQRPVRAPLPSNHECCATGHDVAIPGTSFVVHPPATAFRLTPENESYFITNGFTDGSEVLITLFSDTSPGVNPLRI